jgi:hypothetical protein
MRELEFWVRGLMRGIGSGSKYGCFIVEREYTIMEI